MAKLVSLVEDHVVTKLLNKPGCVCGVSKLVIRADNYSDGKVESREVNLWGIWTEVVLEVSNLSVVVPCESLYLNHLGEVNPL